ncbi:DUF1642 domain-containing protein [Lacticaseibacillus pantheris]|nr:DUF1642 domain-containing protein [Lacticaseibacillus pantheris]
MTSMWMVQNDDGRYLGWSEEFDTFEFMDNNAGYAFNHDNAVHYIRACGGHLVEMVPAKAKVPVNQEEADVLEKAKNPRYRPSVAITSYSNGHGGALQGNDLEDRLIRAYVNGYTVVEPTKYNVKVPHTTDGTYYTKTSAGIGTAYRAANHQETQQFTMAEIKHYGLEDCEREEINTEDSDGVD